LCVPFRDPIPEAFVVHIIREPRVTLIARQQFLPPEHIRWQSDSDVPGQALAEFAGRLCFDRETQVLTRQGWKHFADVEAADEVLTKNPRTGLAEFQRPIARHRYPYQGDLYCAEGRDISFAVTPEHRQWGRFQSSSKRLGEYGFVRTDQIGGRVFAIDCAAEGWAGEYPDAVELPEVSFSQRLANAVGEYATRTTTVAAQPVAGRERIAALARLCAYYATEGSLSRRKGTGQGIVIYGDHVASVVALCGTLDLPHSVWTDPRNGVQRVIVGGGIQWRSFFEQECGDVSCNKKLPRWVLQLPTDELRAIWQILVQTDGHTYADGRQILVTASEEFAGQCQEILCKLGFNSRVVRQSDGQGTNYPTYLVSRKSPKPALLNYRVPVRKEPYEGEVFCLTVPNGTLFVRRHGKPHFSGNCYLSFGEDAGMEGGHKTIPGRTTNASYLANILHTKHGSVLEHAVWSFLFEGVSRALTHELVRHRAGMGFCLSGDTLVYSEHRQRGRYNGTKKRTLRRLFEMTHTPHGRSRLKLLRLRCLDEATGSFTTGRVRDVVFSGIKPVFRVELEDGKQITCTPEHRFLTPDGWQPLAQVVGGLAVSPGGLAVYVNDGAELLVNGVAAYKDREWLRTKYHDEGLEQVEIARQAGVSTHTIRSWVRKHGLQKPIGSWTVGRSPWNRGKRYHAGWTHSDATERRLSEQKTGPGNPRWRGGVTRDAVSLRRPVHARRGEIYQRDDFTCRLCNLRGGKLMLHHIVPVWARADLADDVSNVVTLCRSCHLSLNGRELEYVEHFGRSRSEVPEGATAPRGQGRVLIPRRVRIRSITYVGEQETFDLEMEGPNHNFVANGIITHNSQLSQRYVDESNIAFVVPPEIGEDTSEFEGWRTACEQSLAAYRALLQGLTDQIGDQGPATMRKKRARQAARAVLPNCAETKIVVTGNARSWRHFVEMRGSPSADVEIRRLAVAVLRALHQEAPNIFGDMRIVGQEDGTEIVETSFNKV
jgi:thymidylate synthase ThyX